MVQLTTTEVSGRGIQLLKCLGMGPLFKRQIEQALPAFVPDLIERTTTSRLLYRELDKLVKLKLLDRKRPRGSRCLAFYLTQRGVSVLEGHTGLRPNLGNQELFFSATAHEELVRSVLIEFVLLRRQKCSPIAGLSYSLSNRYSIDKGTDSLEYVPDLTLEIDLMAGQTYTIIVEIDRHTETQATINAKLEKAAAILQAMGKDSLLLFVTLGKRRRDSLRALAQTILPADLALRTCWVTAEAIDAERLPGRIFYSTTGELRPLLTWAPN